jgi:hypothetical protein
MNFYSLFYNSKQKKISQPAGVGLLTSFMSLAQKEPVIFYQIFAFIGAFYLKL